MPNDSDDPSFVEQGIYLSSDQYLIQNESFVYTGSDFSIEFWKYNFDKGIQRMYDAQVNGTPNRIIKVQDWDFSGTNSFLCYIDTL
mmetsp:Transcript_2189/g.1950  ORF Transcript_2189/g.1950 Transcript_2189/m.1950 type:complete len:86 (+) Transcript_2189:440-697(+)